MTNGSSSENQALGRLKRVAEFVGVLGGMGAAFTGLAFAIGYLATKHHDEMLGVPTTVTDYTTFVRTGALFFTQSLHDLVEVIASAARGWKAYLIGSIVAATALFATGYFVPRLRQWLSQATVQRWIVSLGFLFVVVTATAHLPAFLAPLDAGNKSLLFEQRLVEGDAKLVNDELRSIQGEQQLHNLYGREWSIVLALALSVTLLTRARSRIAVEPKPAWLLSVIDRAMRPPAYLIVSILLVTTPAIYGVLAMSTSLPCVQLYTSSAHGELKALGEPGYLVSDLSSEKANVIVLRWDTEKSSYFVDFHPREALQQMEVHYCPVRNPINRVIGKKGGP